MKIIREELNYFREVGEIHKIAKKLESVGIDLSFDKSGIQVSESYGDKKGFRQEYYETSAELNAYYRGLQDGYFHAKLAKTTLFEEPND